MKYAVILTLAVMLVLTACAAPRQKLSPQANVALKTANVYYAQKDTDKALTYYNQVLADNPNYVIALRRVGDINLYMGESIPDKSIEYNKIAYENYKKALDAYATFTETTDNDVIDKRDISKRKDSAWVRIFKAAESLQTAGSSREALAAYDTAYQLDKTRYEPLVKMKEIYVKDLKDNTKAEQIMLQLYQTKPEDPIIIQELAAFYYNSQRYNDALVYFEKARKANPTDVNNLMNIAFCYTELKDYPNALIVTNDILNIAPDNVEALSNASQIAFMMNDDNARLDYLKRLLYIRDNTDDYTAICALFSKNKQYIDMLNYAEKWYKYDSTSKYAVQFLILGAQQTKNKTLEKKYSDILKNM
ncbi:MAG TPA: tetratricopeptide repeat protein [Candidatus Cloacimonadota bacterium]|nr:tetratricopeptide repeat protein [Candidatus Cloacimonadota bacterium]HPS38276.1 tetratricopeptide repeat protein [Candidatus Cloacimonadota bacterium]